MIPPPPPPIAPVAPLFSAESITAALRVIYLPLIFVNSSIQSAMAGNVRDGEGVAPDGMAVPPPSNAMAVPPPPPTD